MTQPDSGHDGTVPPSVLALLVVLGSGALTARSGGALVVVSLPVTVAALVWTVRRREAPPPSAAVLPVFAAMTLFVVVDEYAAENLVLVLAGIAVVLVSAFGLRHPPVVVTGLILGTVLVGVAGTVQPDLNDVVFAHRAAAERVLDRQSPYSDLGVVESNPYNYGASVDGYSYPPVAVVAFALGGRLLGHPSVVVLGLWVAMVLLAGRRYESGSVVPPSLALLPGLVPNSEYTWTEPLTAVLVLGALSLGPGRARAGALGAALASKQYLVVAVPALLVAGWRRWPWLGAALVGAVVVTAPVLLDLSGAFEALGAFHLDRPLRADSSNLAGLMASFGWRTWPVPSVVVLGAAGVFGAVVARRHGPEGWLPGMVASLAVTLAIGPAALPNYWILLALLVLLLLGERERPTLPRRVPSRTEPGARGTALPAQG